MYSGFYKDAVFPMMRQHGIRRIFAMGTRTLKQPEDRWSLMQTMVTTLMPYLANGPYQKIIGVKNVFEHDAGDLDWTVFRIASIPGEADEASWEKNRDIGKLFTGYVGETGWTATVDRALLARWLCDAAESGAVEWVRKWPAVSRLAGS